MTEIKDIYNRLVKIISEVTEISEDQILPESNIITDLEIDSLDFLDITFALDKEYDIKLPVDKWTKMANEHQEIINQYFTVDNICKEIYKQINSE